MLAMFFFSWFMLNEYRKRNHRKRITFKKSDNSTTAEKMKKKKKKVRNLQFSRLVGM